MRTRLVIDFDHIETARSWVEDVAAEGLLPEDTHLMDTSVVDWSHERPEKRVVLTGPGGDTGYVEKQFTRDEDGVDFDLWEGERT